MAQESGGKIKNALRAFVPSLPNALVEGALRMMSFFDHVPKRCRENNREENLRIWKEKYEERFSEAYIENQSELKDLKLGKSDMAYAGCEVISVYNSLLFLSRIPASTEEGRIEKKPLPELISRFEDKGVILNGNFGTSPRQLCRYLSGLGLEARFTTKRSLFEKLASESEAFILTVYNDKKNIMQEIHTICITKEGEGVFRAHNSLKCRESVEGFGNLEQKLGLEGRGKVLAMTGIRRKSNMA